MRAVIQRVSEASVRVDGEIVGQIGRGLVVLLGVCSDDTQTEAEYLSDKIVGLRIFSDDAGKFAFSVQDIQGEILVVSQFTLYGDYRKGRRPSFTDAAGIDTALPLYEYFVACVKRHQVPVATGQFQATMAVQLVNDGPVTLIKWKGTPVRRTSLVIPMPKAGFWAIDPTRKISFGKDGWWYANDERIQNRRINVLFSQYLRRTRGGNYEIAIGWDKVAVEIDDTPYVVTRVRVILSRGLHCGSMMKVKKHLIPFTLIGQDHVLYCRVKGGRTPRPLPSPSVLPTHCTCTGRSKHMALFSHGLANTAFPISLATSKE